MQKMILDTQRVSSQLEIDILKAKNTIIQEATGIQHHLDIEELVRGGYVVSIWVDEVVVNSGEYIIQMISGIEKIERACRTMERAMREQAALDQADNLMTTPAGQAAANQVADFFSTTRH